MADRREVAGARLPSLSDSEWLRYVTFAALYVAQGIPEGFLFYAVPAWLASHGLSAAQIGAFVGISILPWSFKLINAPLMDRFTYLPMGRRRPWVLLGQCGLVVSFGLFGLIDNPGEQIVAMTALGFLVSFFGSFQDVAVDGMAIDVLPEHQQARANGIMWGSKTVGISSAVAVGAFSMNRWGFSATVMLFAAGVLAIMVFPVLFRERPGEKRFFGTRGRPSPEAKANQLHDWKSIFVSLRSVFFLPVSLLMGVAVFSTALGRGMIDTFLPIVTVQELGWSDTAYANAFAVANLISGLVGMVVAGALVDFFGKVRMMKVFLVGLTVTVLAMSLAAGRWGTPGVVFAFIIGFYVLQVSYTVAVFATAMQLCWKRVAATQFTLYMAVSNLGLAVGPVLFGQLTRWLSYSTVLLFYLVFSGFSLMIYRLVRLERHQPEVDRLEREMADMTAPLIEPGLPLDFAPAAPVD